MQYKRITPTKGTRLYSIIKWKCPGCQETDLFISRNPYRFGYALKMPDGGSV